MSNGSSLIGPLGIACESTDRFDQLYPGEKSGSQPIHTVYGGAHLFSADTIGKLNKLALKSFEDYAPNASSFAAAFEISDKRLSAAVYQRLMAVLKAGCVQDFRIDFEDGFGYRSNDEEDKAAVAAAQATALAARQQQLPGSFGIRIKPLNSKSGERAVRTLEFFLDSLVRADGVETIGNNFVVALPKIAVVEQVTALASMLDMFETRFALPANTIKVEIMVEHPQLFCNADGRGILPDLVRAARGRCRGAHFGAYDYQSLCGIVGSVQRLDHFSCDWVRHNMQVALVQTGVWLSDGATNELPIAPHRNESELSIAQMEENTAAVHAAWRAHFRNVGRALSQGFYQGWDLHPAQIPARYAALYVFYLSSLHEMTLRLKSFVANSARATLSGTSFDDLATAQGLARYFLRAVACDAISTADVGQTGLTLEELRSRTFNLAQRP